VGESQLSKHALVVIENEGVESVRGWRWSNGGGGGGTGGEEERRQRSDGERERAMWRPWLVPCKSLSGLAAPAPTSPAGPACPPCLPADRSMTATTRERERDTRGRGAGTATPHASRPSVDSFTMRLGCVHVL